jgi:predicted RNA-binding Zn-ribbon protein involved in translation (DUF1610 family)
MKRLLEAIKRFFGGPVNVRIRNRRSPCPQCGRHAWVVKIDVRSASNRVHVTDRCVNCGWSQERAREDWT